MWDDDYILAKWHWLLTDGDDDYDIRWKARLWPAGSDRRDLTGWLFIPFDTCRYDIDWYIIPDHSIQSDYSASIDDP